MSGVVNGGPDVRNDGIARLGGEANGWTKSIQQKPGGCSASTVAIPDMKKEVS
jgi:hypothetical protein